MRQIVRFELIDAECVHYIARSQSVVLFAHFAIGSFDNATVIVEASQLETLQSLKRYAAISDNIF